MARLRAGHARPRQSRYYKVEGIKNPTTGGGGIELSIVYYICLFTRCTFNEVVLNALALNNRVASIFGCLARTIRNSIRIVSAGKARMAINNFSNLRRTIYKNLKLAFNFCQLFEFRFIIFIRVTISASVVLEELLVEVSLP